MNYKFDDAWRVTADYNNYDYKRSYNQTSTGLPTDKRFLDKEEYKFVLSYHKDGWNANAFIINPVLIPNIIIGKII